MPLPINHFYLIQWAADILAANATINGAQNFLSQVALQRCPICERVLERIMNGEPCKCCTIQEGSSLHTRVAVEFQEIE